MSRPGSPPVASRSRRTRCWSACSMKQGCGETATRPVRSATPSPEVAAAGAASLQVALDLAHAVGLLDVRVVAHLAGRPAPAQQVPALVEGFLELLQPLVLLARGDLPAAQLLPQLVLLVDQAVNPAQHIVVIHG